LPIIRYRTEGVPARAAAACTPIPATNPIASSAGLMHRVGSPSTTRIASPRPQSTRGRGNLSLYDSGRPADQAQPSGNSPDYILPSLYWAPPTPQVVSHSSTNEIPIPAISTQQPYAPASATAPGQAVTPAVVQRARRMGGRLVQAWPKVVPFWPTFGSGQNNSANSGQVT
jgi:hypothetical protein